MTAIATKERRTREFTTYTRFKLEVVDKYGSVKNAATCLSKEDQVDIIADFVGPGDSIVITAGLRKPITLDADRFYAMVGVGSHLARKGYQELQFVSGGDIFKEAYKFLKTIRPNGRFELHFIQGLPESVMGPLQEIKAS